ncbi:sulfurtransferase [Litchfieldia alkalitelluris]|uniref:sulfurtransferase n=1 Tax=Litchfieldia alkalitelluris TaxID=304268 RepID=UPI000997D5A3|nr:sulfurtransferase [Litchfieldia alkalitelluris]
MSENIVSVSWLNENISSENIKVIDCRFHLTDPVQGFNDYLEGHIPGALYFDLNKDLSSEVKEHGGRHPLPNIQDFSEKLGAAGITFETTVIAYDDQAGAFASRLWWLLRFIGHKKVFVLDEGYSAWINSGLPITKEIPQFQKLEYIPNQQQHFVANVEDVKQSIQQNKGYIIDSREAIRYKGIEEPIDNKAGHIPGAINHFWKDVLDNQKWKNKQQLEDLFTDLDKDKEVVVYCGSGVTACPNVLALNELGFKNVQLYPGSWSDWITYPENPIRTMK